MISTAIRTLVRSGAFESGFSAFVAQKQPWMRVLMYHGVQADQADAFARQLKYLASRFRVVPLAALLEPLSGSRRPAYGQIVITFDDGLRNNFTVVYPILQRLKIPATFFVCPGLLGTSKWLWNHEARERLHSISVAERSEFAKALGVPHSDVEGIVEWMKDLAPRRRGPCQDAIRAATPRFVASAAQHEAFDIMSWEELSSLDADLVTIGSHTTSHPILTLLPGPELQNEIAGSRASLERFLGRPVEFFCYPNGAHDERVVRCVRESYLAAVTTEPGPVVPGDDRYRLRRIPSAPSLPLLAWRLHRPDA